MKITKKDLYQTVNVLNNLTGNKFDFSIGYAYGSPRLYAKHKSIEISPRLSTSQLYTWIYAYIDGITFALQDLKSLNHDS